MSITNHDMTSTKALRRSRKTSSSISQKLLAAVLLINTIPTASSTSPARNLIPRKTHSQPVQYGNVVKRANTIPLVVSNNCGETVWPGIASQSGTGPGTGGFELAPGSSKRMNVSADWQGRVWGRTNCSFNLDGSAASNLNGNNAAGQACGTGDCNGVLNCIVTGDTPVTLAEFDLSGGMTGKQTYYDLSLVDGYNLPMGLVFLPNGNPNLTEIPPNLTNAACIATSGLFSPPSSYGISGNASNSSYPIPYESTQTAASVAGWCPWDLQLTQPTKPGDGVYPYPDDNIQRPIFDPCLSACAKTNKASDCCTGKYDDPKVCKPGLYSHNAKSVCPDAYSFAFDDTTSTFIIPNGGGWEVKFCPPGRSTNILKTFGAQLNELANTGVVSKSILKACTNITLINEQASAAERAAGEGLRGTSLGALVLVVAWAVLW